MVLIFEVERIPLKFGVTDTLPLSRDTFVNNRITCALIFSEHQLYDIIGGYTVVFVSLSLGRLSHFNPFAEVFEVKN